MAISSADSELTVSTDGTAGPYVIVTPEQLSPVVEALRMQRVRFHVDQDAVMLNGAPALAVIDLGSGADVTKVQGILDRVAIDMQGKSQAGRQVRTRKELIIRGDAEAMRRLQERFAKGGYGGWDRRVEVEERFRHTFPQHTTAFCFAKLVPAVSREVAVLMQSRGPGTQEELQLSGIVPLTSRRQLSLDEYDQVVEDFRATFVNPLSEGLGVRVVGRNVNAEALLEDVISTAALARLRTFAVSANKSILNGLDFRRWAGFVGQTHMDDTIVDLKLLDAWLVDEGFQEMQRKELIDEFESGRRLLNVYEDEQPK